MGFDPVSIAMIASTAIGAGTAIYGATQKPKPPQVSPPAVPVSGEPETAGKLKKMRPPAQLFRDEDLRLGAAGKLGL